MLLKKFQIIFLNYFAYQNIDILDKKDNSILIFFDKTIQFIKTQINDGKKIFFTHCYFGASRSAIIILLFLVKIFNFPLEDARILLNEKKKDIININIKFLDELKEYLEDS